jgi:hypothetical protein
MTVPLLTLVTLDCTPVDIVMSVKRGGGAVYSPRVLRPCGHGLPGVRSTVAIRVDVAWFDYASI